MTDWISLLKHNPIEPLLGSNSEVIIYFTRRDLLEKEVSALDYVWNLPEPQKILRRQQADGSWKASHSRATKNSGVKYALVETWRHLRYLIEQYGFNKKHQAIEKASEFLFSCQTDEGDIRGILANQYADYYTGAIIYLLIKAGYENDPRTMKGLQWLIRIRQSDGGWVGLPGLVGIPNLTWKETCDLTSNKNRVTSTAFDKSRPFSAQATGMAIRAFAVHPTYNKSEYALVAARLLKSKFFKKDNWTSYEHPDNWVRFQFPFWWNNLVSALDSISLIGLSREDEDIQNALKWLSDHQERNGLWKESYSRIHKAHESRRSHEAQLWISLAICRILKRFYGNR
jgi:hypothetical protein